MKSEIERLTNLCLQLISSEETASIRTMHIIRCWSISTSLPNTAA